MNLKITKKVAVIFLSLLIFFTLCSRTIHYLMLPKVVASKPVWDSLSNEYTITSDIEIFVFDTVAISIDEKLSRSLYIKEVHVNNDDFVQKGDPLITFNTYEYKVRIKELKTDLENLKVEYTALEYDFNTTLNELSHEADDLQERISLIETGDFSREIDLFDSQANISRLKSDYEYQKEMAAFNIELYTAGLISSSALKAEQAKEKNLKEEIPIYEEKLKIAVNNKLEAYKYELENKNMQINFMKSKGIINNQSIYLLAEKIKEVNNELKALEKFKEDFQLTAPVSGTVKDLKANINDDYRGINALGYIEDENSEKGLKVALDKERVKDLKRGMEVTIQLEEGELTGVIDRIVKENDWHMIIKPKTISVNVDEIIAISIKQGSSEKQYLIPCSALVQASSPYVYVLKEKKTFFGKEYYVEKRDIRIRESNDEYIYAGKDITPNDIIVTGWDRSLEDGMTVKLLDERDVQ
jgi:multidrug resistance efflux pump